MNNQFKTTFTSILLAITVAAASGVVEAGRGGGNGAGSHSGGGFGSGNGAMYGSGPATGYGYETRNSNQYRHQRQHQYRSGNGGNAAGPGTGQYSDDKYLNQQDFQAWLNQDQSKARTQNHNQVQNMAQDGL